MTPNQLTRALQSEFSIEHRAGGNLVSDDYLGDFIAKEFARSIVAKDRVAHFAWGYFNNGGRNLNITFDKKYANQNADGFFWDNPRVRKIGLIHPL